MARTDLLDLSRDAMTQRIMIIRHAEKPTPMDPGLDEQGHSTKAGLSVRGWQRAGAFVPYFSSPHPSSHCEPPGALYAARDSDRSSRPRLTVQPLGAALGLPVVGHFPSGGGEHPLVDQVLRESGPVLICWRHDWIPALARILVSDAPRGWAEDVYDETWVLTRKGDRPWSLTVVQHKLLAGDRP